MRSEPAPLRTVGAALAASIALALCVPEARAQGSLWVVDQASGSGTDFVELQPAIDAAAEGDAILVRSGVYPPFAIDGKALTLIADEGSDVQVRNLAFAPYAARIANLSASQAVVLDGVDVAMVPFGLFTVPGLSLEDNDGMVLLEDAVMRGAEFEAGSVQIADCASVSLVRCVVRGGSNQGHGLLASDSTVTAYNSQFSGSRGRNASSTSVACVDPGRGGDGAFLTGSSLYAAGCSFQGGEGAGAVDPASPLMGAAGGTGGDGVRLSGSSFEWLDSTFVPGAGGLPSFSCPGGSDGTEVSSGPAASLETAGLFRSLSVDSPVREGQPTTLTFRGDSFDFLVLSVSPEPFPGLPLPPFVGRLHVGSPSFLFKFGLLPLFGTKSATVSVDLVPGEDYARLFLQAAHFGLAGDFVLGSPTSLLVLDDAF